MLYIVPEKYVSILQLGTQRKILLFVQIVSMCSAFFAEWFTMVLNHVNINLVRICTF